MALIFSTALRNYVLDTGSLADALAGGRIVIFGGDASTFPQNPEEAVNVTTHPVLMEVTNISMGTASLGTLPKEAAAWTAPTITGLPIAFRHVDSTDDSLGDDTAAQAKRRIQGSVGAGGDMFLTQGAFSGVSETINFHNITLPSSLVITG